MKRNVLKTIQTNELKKETHNVMACTITNHTMSSVFGLKNINAQSRLDANKRSRTLLISF